MSGGLTQLLNAGITGLSAATQAMQTVSNNTANVNTPGYNVESVTQTELPGSAGGPGAGANVTSVQRAFDRYVYQEVVRAGSASQSAQIVQTNAQNLSAIFPVASGGANGLGAAMSSFFAAANQVTQDPASLPTRQVLIGRAQALAADFNSVGAQLAENLTGIGTQIGTAVQQINALCQQIATLNKTVTAHSSGLAGPPNALLDARDDLVRQLGQQIGVVSMANADGSVDVYTTGGAQLVHGASASSLAVSPSGYHDGGVAIAYGATGQDLTDTIAGGALGGLLTARSQSVAAQDSVGALAASLSIAVNAQQTLGLDLGGNQGSAFFATSGPTLHAAQSNTGSATLAASISDPNALVPGDFIITKTASGFTATNLATGAVAALGAGPSLSLAGMTITVAGTAASGDSFKLDPTGQSAQGLRLVIDDPGKIAAAAPYVVTAGGNLGDVAATVAGAADAAALPPGAVNVPAAQFGADLSIRFTSGSAFQVLDGNAVVASGSFDPANGATLAIAYPAPPGKVVTVVLSSGTPAAGDSFALTPGGSGSNANMVALAGLATQNLLAGQTLSNAYAGTVATVGNNGQSANVAAQAAQGVLTRAQSVQQSISGVNLDEQAANLVSDQQAYQAAAAVIAAAQTLFDSLLSAVRAG